MNLGQELAKLERKADGDPQGRCNQMNRANIVRGNISGIIAGTISTILIDIVAMIMLAPMGISLGSFFALIGRCLLTLIGANAPDPVWPGITLHFSLAILTGLIISLLSQKFKKLQFGSYRKGILLSILIAEVEGNSLFYLMSVIMNFPQSEMEVMYGLCFILHLIWGTCLGSILCIIQRRRALTSGNSSVSG
jgi:hypothetical protein